jgi:tripartite-type tricarboxylate transporter receptor subunit TctC
MHTRRTSLKALGAAALSMGAARLYAADVTPISVYVGAASSMDFTARVVADQLSQSLKRTAVVMSRLGAGQRLALNEVKHAAPDGTSLLYATSGPFSIYPNIYTKLDYDPDRDFTPITGISSFDVAIATGPLTGTKNLKDLLAWTRDKGSQGVFGAAPGMGSLSHFVGLSVSLATSTPMTMVPYKDSGVGIVDLAGSRLPMMVTGLQPLIELHKAGKIKIVAVSGGKRSPLVPDVPTLREAGVDLSSTTTTGVFGPPRMSAQLVSKLAAAIAPIFTNVDTQDKLAQQAMNPWQASGQELAAQLRDERKHFAELVKAGGLVPQEA